MGTTGSSVALDALAGLKDVGTRFALLHGADGLTRGAISDLDTVVGEHPFAVIRQALVHWCQSGLHPILIWQYDVGGTTTVFLSKPDASAGVQLDMLYDPLGRGKYGIRSDAILEFTESASPVDVITDAARLVYLYQKRRRKGQYDRVREVVAAATALPRDELQEVAERVTGATDLLAAVDGRELPMARNRDVARNMVRKASRLMTPIGHWAHVASEEVASELSGLFGRVLTVVAASETPGALGEPLWYIRNVVPVRYRAGAFFSWGTRVPRLLPGGAVVHATDHSAAANAVVLAMEQRALACVS